MFFRAGDDCMIVIRSNAEREEDKKVYIPEEEQGKIGQVELNYVKKFQKFQDHKIKLCNDDREALLVAKRDGSLHVSKISKVLSQNNWCTFFSDPKVKV